MQNWAPQVRHHLADDHEILVVSTSLIRWCQDVLTRCNSLFTWHTDVTIGMDGREPFHSLQPCSAAQGRKLRTNEMQLKVQERQMLRCVIARMLGLKKPTVQLQVLCGLIDFTGLRPHFYIGTRKIHNEFHSKLHRRKNLACPTACSLSRSYKKKKQAAV